MSISTKWDLDSIFPGGSVSLQFRDFLRDVEQSIHTAVLSLEEVLRLGDSISSDFSALIDVYGMLERLKLQLDEADSYVECLTLQNAQDTAATLLTDKVASLRIRFGKVEATFRQYLSSLSEDTWEALLRAMESEEKVTVLSLMRHSSSSVIEPDVEEMISNLSVTGFHAWEDMYNLSINRLNLKDETLSYGEALQAMMLHPERSYRQKVYNDYIETSEQESQLFATILNNIAGYRLEMCNYRGSISPFSEALVANRVQRETVETMMGVVIQQAKGWLQRYFNQKAKLLHLERLGWYDVGIQVNGYAKEFPIDEAARLIENSLSQHSPSIGAFAIDIFNRSWIDSEDRTNKSHAIRELYFPYSKQARVTIRYNNHFSLLSLLAHEIGHAYHDQLLEDQSGFLRDVPLGLAETASTLTEFVMLDGARHHIQEKEGQLGLLENKIQTSIINLALIPVRYIFERDFYELRKQGPVSVSSLNDLMVKAQREIFGEYWEAYDPYMWMSTRHFYFTKTPFYNFPYVVGHCISSIFFSQIAERGMLEKYNAFLRDSGKYSIEVLTEKYLSEDITKPDFWENACKEVARDVDEFVAFTNDESN